jgi:hypothetical protein
LTAAVLGACHGGTTVLQFANTADAEEWLTLRLTITSTTKTRLVSMFHGISTGTYVVRNERGVVAQGTFNRDDKGFDFKASDGTSMYSKVNSDGTFEYLSRTWTPTVNLLLHGSSRELKSVKDLKRAATSTASISR